MEKRNAMLLIVMAVATLLVTVAETSFAFSASTQANTGMPNTEEKGKGVASLSTSYDKAVSVTVNQDLESVIMDSANVNVKLLASNEGEISKCTYDIIYVWNSAPHQELEVTDNTLQDKYYIKTATVEKELTISGKANITSGIENSSEGTIAHSLKETNINKFPLFNRGDMDYFILVNDAVISSASISSPTEVNWNFELKFYNVNKDQSHLNGKTFGGYITVDQNSMEC